MKSISSIKFIDLIIIGLLVSLSFMLIPAWIPILRKGWQLLALLTIIIIIKKQRFINKESLFSLFIYGVILLFNSLTGDAYIGNVTNAIYEILLMFVISSLSLYCMKSNNMNFNKHIIYVTLIFLAIELIASYFVLLTSPGIIRGMNAMIMEENNMSLMFFYYRMGLLDYSMAHAIPILIPPLIYYFRQQSGRKKLFTLILIISCILLTWLSESATALMLSLLMVLLGFLTRNYYSTRKNVIITTVLVLPFIFVLYSEELMVNFFEISERVVGKESIYSDKIEEMRLSMIENQTTGDLESRTLSYRRSIDLFSNNVIIGSNEMPGRHAALLDRMASLGLIGIIPLLSFFVISLRQISRYLPHNRRIYYIECIIAAFLMLTFKGLWVWPIFFFLFIVAPCALNANDENLMTIK